MEPNMFNLNSKIYSNNNYLLFQIINELQQISNSSRENLTIKRIGDIINKMNFIINENKKNTDLIIKHISLLQSRIDNNFKELKNNNISNQDIRYNDGARYVGQVVNGIREGKGILYFKDGDRYEGDFKNGKREGRGI